jgi:Abnormal spindle-like microcephaly-assoc'd, ASPM-SPD-2-Hydin
VRDLRSRSNTLVVLLALGSILGGSAVQGRQRTVSGSTALVAGRSAVEFGSVVVGSSALVTDYISNPSSSNITISGATVSGSVFQISQPALPVTIPPGQRSEFVISFTPQTPGISTGTIAISSSAEQPSMTLSVSGTAVAAGQIGLNPSSINFGSVPLSGSRTQTATVTNSGGTNLVISQVVASSSDFATSGLSLPSTLEPGQTLNFNVTFAPRASGTRAGVISLTSSASLSTPNHVRRRGRPATAAANETASISLSGVGAQVASTGTTLGAITAAPATLNFGSPLVGTTVTAPLTLTNSGTASVTLSQVAATGAGYSLSGPSLPLTLTAAQTASFTVTFAPKAITAGSGAITIASTASNPAFSVPLSAAVVAPGALAASFSSLVFGTVQVGTSQKQTATITNSSSSNVTVSGAVVSGAGFSMGGMSMPMTLAPKQSMNISITCAPKTAGALNGSLTINSNASDATLALPLSVTAVAPSALTVTPSSFSFGSVQTGSTHTLAASLTNTGGSSVTVTQASFTGSGYSVGGLTLPITLAAGQSTAFNVIFAPQSAGTDNFNLAIASNASNPTLAAPVSGTALTAGALTASAPSLSFGSVQTGNSRSLPETLTNSGGSSITLTQTTAGAGYTVSGMSLPLTLAAGASTSFSVMFSPQTTGSSSVNLAITSSSPASTLTIPLSGAGLASGTLSAGPVSFGSVQVGSSGTETAALVNSGGSSVNISKVTLTGAGFGMSGLSTPLTLAAGQSFTFTTTFTPLTAGAASGSIAIVSTASASPSIALSGTATSAGQLALSPGTFSFGSVVVGGSKSLPATLAATGASVTVTSASVSSSEYALGGLSLPLTLQPGTSVPFTLTFTPQASGAATASVSISTSASSSPVVQAVTGSGTPPPQHSVQLSWSASSSAVAGYNIYRGSVSNGPYARIDSAVDTVTTYTDTSVQAGDTYFYVTTAVASDGTESAFSNQVSAAVPTP